MPAHARSHLSHNLFRRDDLSTPPPSARAPLGRFAGRNGTLVIKWADLTLSTSRKRRRRGCPSGPAEGIRRGCLLLLASPVCLRLGAQLGSQGARIFLARGQIRTKALGPSRVSSEIPWPSPRHPPFPERRSRWIFLACWPDALVSLTARGTHGLQLGPTHSQSAPLVESANQTCRFRGPVAQLLPLLIQLYPVLVLVVRLFKAGRCMLRFVASSCRRLRCQSP